MKLKRAGKEATPTDGAEASKTSVAPAKGRSNNLVPALVLAVGLLGGGFFMGSGDQGAVGAAPPAPAEAEESGASQGPVQSLEPITLNLADGHFLKVGIALQLAEAEAGHGEDAEEVPSAKALDIAITLLGSHTMDELSNPKERSAAKAELSKMVAKAYVDPETHAPKVTEVYFTEFVMQ